MVDGDILHASGIDGENRVAADNLDDQSPSGSRPDKSESARPSVIVRPVVNALRIMRLLSSGETGRTAAQIASELKINRSTCFNILKTLTDERAIDFDRGSKTYFMALGHEHWQAGLISEQRRLAAARQLMRRLSDRYSVTVSLWKRLRRDRLTLVAVEHSPSALRIHVTEGQRVPILMGSSGRVMAAHLGLDKQALEEGFNKLRWQMPINFEDYFAEVAQAHENGYGVDEGHYARGVTSIGAAVLDSDENPQFSVTAIMFLGQHDQENIAIIGGAMRALGSELSQILT